MTEVAIRLFIEQGFDQTAINHNGHSESVDYQALMTAAVEAGGDGLGARRAAVVLGWGSASASRIEGARARLKPQVERG